MGEINLDVNLHPLGVLPFQTASLSVQLVRDPVESYRHKDVHCLVCSVFTVHNLNFFQNSLLRDMPDKSE